MIIIGACISLSIILSLYFIKRDTYDRWLLVCILSLMGCLAGLAFSFIALLVAPEICVSPQLTPIYNLSISNRISSNFYLGATYIDQNLTYFYYTKESNGGYQVHSVLAQTSEVYEKEDAKPTVTTFTIAIDPRYSWMTIFGPKDVCGANFTVPPGSIDNNYHVG